MDAEGRGFNLDGLLDLQAALLRLAVADLRRGPGRTPKQQQDYRTARRYLALAGLLDIIEQRYALRHDLPAQLEVAVECVDEGV
jgi:hypothetical protein